MLRSSPLCPTVQLLRRHRLHLALGAVERRPETHMVVALAPAKTASAATEPTTTDLAAGEGDAVVGSKTAKALVVGSQLANGAVARHHLRRREMRTGEEVAADVVAAVDDGRWDTASPHSH